MARLNQPVTVTSTAPAVGSVVRAVPVGQARRQFIEVARVEDGLVFGWLLSRKWPGNYRGRAVAEIEQCEAAQMTTVSPCCRAEVLEYDCPRCCDVYECVGCRSVWDADDLINQPAIR